MTRKIQTTPVAIIGLGAVMPDANDLNAFWENIKTGRDSIREVPLERWLTEDHYDPDPKAPDKTYCKIGAWVSGFEFNPLGFRIPPKVAAAMDPVQQWVVESTRQALKDAGYEEKDFDRNRTAVIIGNAMAGEMQHITNHRVYFPRYLRQLRSTRAFRDLPEEAQRALVTQFESTFMTDIPPITEDSMPGELANCIAGRVANVFGLRGPNYTADAACASSLAALEAALAGLTAKRYDLVITGGSDSSMGPHSFIKFCKIGALSAEMSCPFDQRANGFVMGEGCGILVLKRLKDAVRDEDKIYAVIRGVGSSSDGRGKGITAPNPAGQKLAVERAYSNAGLSPADITLLEAHGTSTTVGDSVEGNLACEFLKNAGAGPGSIAMGSVKSQIGHLKGAAGAAALIKTAKAIHEGLIPASLHFEQPNPNIPFDGAPVYVPTECRPWETSDGKPRTAGVSSFGFGGANFHAVLSEYRPESHKKYSVPPEGQEIEKETTTMKTDSKILAVGGKNREEIKQALEEQLTRPREQDPVLPPEEVSGTAERLLISHANDKERTTRAQRALKSLTTDQPGAWRALSNQGIFRGRGQPTKIAFLFPGQGSQYINMLKELREQEPLVAEAFEMADGVMTPLLGRPLTSFIYTDDNDATREALKDTNVCQPAMLTADVAIARVLEKHGVVPDMVAGHSLGEYAALVVAGMLSFEEALHAVSARAREMSSVQVDDPGKMAAVLAPEKKILELIQDIDGVAPANFNSRNQTVIGGGTAAVEEALRRMKAEGIRAVELQVSHAFHSHIVAPAVGPLRKMLDKFNFQPPRIPLVANVDARPYDPDPGAMQANLDRLAKQIASPVRFVESLETMHRLGAHLFIEVGAKRVLANFVTDVLADPEVISVATSTPKLGDWPSIQNALAACAAAGNREPVVEAPTPEIHTRDHAGTEVVISGASLGLPGEDHPVFDEANVDRILEGQSGITPIPETERRYLASQRVVRLVKDAPGGPVFEVIEKPDEVVRLAGRKGAFDLSEEFGLDPKRVQSYDVTTQLAIAAGLLALKDAGIPLVMHHRATTTGKTLPTGFRLPEQLAEETGVIFASAFPGYDQLIGQMNLRHQDDMLDARIAELKQLAATVGPLHAVRERLEALEKERGQRYNLDRKFIFRVLNFGHAQFAELIGARGPNTSINAACAATTQALAIASDWIRLGRCRRVLVVGADDITNENLFPWVTGGMFATGAVTTESQLENAALPFDRRRNGMICGMGAVGLVVEDAKLCKQRGTTALVRMLGSLIANSAHHGTRLNQDHIAGCMERLVSQVELEHGLDRRQMADKTVFMSHETYTPARGGSASAEVHSLRKTFGDNADRIVIANTKGFTGHPMGVGIEDSLSVRILERQIVPPIPNHREEDPDLGPLNLSKGGHHNVHYALRLAAGFGSQIAITLTEKIAGGGDRIADQAVNQAWLERVSGITDAKLEVINKTLRIKETTDTIPASASAPEAKPVPEPVPAIEPAPAPQAAAEQSEAAPIGVPQTEPEKSDVDTNSLKDKILAIVSEKTGYPTDMLDLDLDLEADLGIDTVKQAEMFSEIRAAFGIPKQDDLKLSDYPTLNHVIKFAQDKMGTPVAPQAAAEQSEAAPIGVPQTEPAPEITPEPVPEKADADVGSVKDKILAIVSEKTGYPTDMLDLDLDLEADLGIDTVKQAEMFSEIRAAFGIPKQDDLKLSDYPTLNHVIQFAKEKMGTPPEPEPQKEIAHAHAHADAHVDVDGVKDKILAIVSEKTGYPTDMLDLDLDLEADLGIDTVKQAEMFSEIRAAFGIPKQEDLKLSDYPTLNHVIQFAQDKMSSAPVEEEEE
jgi:malonyl CoA-acyl carrier protein transacylase